MLDFGGVHTLVCCQFHIWSEDSCSQSVWSSWIRILSCVLHEWCHHSHCWSLPMCERQGNPGQWAAATVELWSWRCLSPDRRWGSWTTTEGNNRVPRRREEREREKDRVVHLRSATSCPCMLSHPAPRLTSMLRISIEMDLSHPPRVQYLRA